ncbi:hypothetical protein O6H91_18G003100 [Diphasiastrum complanatum]|uniref:Uncharacterized protein n=1 Tax=Diphasiastrum complanatum TaxID=34168 RepID=A0ACC2AXJ5_DIPCM|nr:hypothetical protein O6H91_18G003100 [Diphasiastrum complanatum]
MALLATAPWGTQTALQKRLGFSANPLRGCQHQGLKKIVDTAVADVHLLDLSSSTAHKPIMCRASAPSAVMAPRRERDPKKRVVITGMGLASVFGNDLDVYYEKLLEGQSGVDIIDRFDVSKHSTKFAGQIRNFSMEGYIDPKVDSELDNCFRYCLVGGKKALEHAHLGIEQLNKIDKERVGVLVGTGMGGSTVFSEGVQSLIKGNDHITPLFLPYTLTNMGSALLAIEFGFMGPNYSISTACATANFCFYSAANHIRKGDADIIVAGGTEAALVPAGLGGFAACRALSQRNSEPQTASRPWDKGRDGFVMGEGAGVLIMESLEHAMSRGAPILAEYLGGAITCDAYHMTDPRADGLGVSTCIRKALEDAGVSPEESMIGHCLGAAGGLEAIATIKGMITGWIHPTINQFNPEPSVTFDTVSKGKQQHEISVGISNSFGFGGHNSVVVFAPFSP